MAHVSTSAYMLSRSPAPAHHASSAMMGTTPSTDFAITAGLEDRFCKNFSCCGVTLDSLHDLLQHFEEVHVRVESDFEGMGGMEEDDLPFEFETMDHDAAARMGRPTAMHHGQPHHPHHLPGHSSLLTAPHGMMPGVASHSAHAHHPHHAALGGGDALYGMMLHGTNNPEPKASFSALKHQQQSHEAAIAATTAAPTDNFHPQQQQQQRTPSYGAGPTMSSSGHPGNPTPPPSPSPGQEGPSSLLPSFPGRPLSSEHHLHHPPTLTNAAAAPGHAGPAPGGIAPSPSKEHAALAFADLYASSQHATPGTLGPSGLPLIQRSPSCPAHLQPHHAYGTGGAPLAYPPTLGASAFDTSVIRKRSPHPSTHPGPGMHGHAAASLLHQQQHPHHLLPPHPHPGHPGENATIPFVFDGPTQIIHDPGTQAGAGRLPTVVSMDEDGISPVDGGTTAAVTAAAGSGTKADGKGAAANGSAEDRPYKCKFPGCNKSYKNPGGIKYHMQHGHCEDTGDPEMNNIIHKPYQCTFADCQKRYKNLNGLKYHIEHFHFPLHRPPRTGADGMAATTTTTL